MTITIRSAKAATVSCPNCGKKVKSSPTGTATCPDCGSTVPNPKMKSSKVKKPRHNGPQDGGFYPSKQPKGPLNDPKDKGGGKSPAPGKTDAAPDAMTPEQKKVYQQAYNKVLSQTKDKAKADKAGKAAIKASGVKKSESSSGVEYTQFEITATLEKASDEKMQVFGWAYVSEKDGQPVVDHSGEWASIEEIEKAIYRYAQESRDVGEMHVAKGRGHLIESVVYTADKYQAMFPWMTQGQISKATKGAWVGFQLYDPEVFAKIKRGEYPMLSIHGKALRKEVTQKAAAPGPDLVLMAKSEIGHATSYAQLSKNAKAYVDIVAGQIRSERLDGISKGVGPNRHGSSIKCPDIYEALKREGKSKETAAQMSNECYSTTDCNCH